MPDTSTARFGLTKPEQGASADDWGGKLNANFDLIDAAVLPRSGVDAEGDPLGMTGPLLLAAGTVEDPALAFAADDNTGLYRAAENELGVAAGGSAVCRFTPDGLSFAADRTLALAPSLSTGASFNLPPGTAPAAPAAGDLWATSTDLFVRLNGTSHRLTGGAAASADRWSTARSIGFSGGDVTGSTVAFDGSANVTGVNLSIGANRITTAMLQADAVTSAKILDGAASTAKIADDAVTNAKLANMATARLKGRVASGTGDPEDLTQAQVRSFLGLTGVTPHAALHATVSLGTVTTVASANLSVVRTGTGAYTFTILDAPASYVVQALTGRSAGNPLAWTLRTRSGGAFSLAVEPLGGGGTIDPDSLDVVVFAL